MQTNESGAVQLDQISVTERQFPTHIRADLQVALSEFVQDVTVSVFTGVNTESGLGGVDFSSLLDEGLIQISGLSSSSSPPQYEHIDIGEDEPVPALKNGLWCIKRGGKPAAILYAPLADFGDCGVSQRIRLQVATVSDDLGEGLARDFF